MTNDPAPSLPAPYWYELPEARIAQRPVYPPESAKMLVVDRPSGRINERSFFDFPAIARPGDVLVYNDTAVVKSRIFGKLEPSMIDVEVLLVQKLDVRTWKAMGRPLRRFNVGRKIVFPNGLQASISERMDANYVRLSFECDSRSTIDQAIDAVAVMPIPPYIRGGRADEQDTSDYQTIFASNRGSIAAPTASLHFTPQLIASVEGAGCAVVPLTLHVGVASFKSVYSEAGSLLQPPETEAFEIGQSTREAISKAKVNGGRVIALGTTVARALESSMADVDSIAGLRPTSLFIRPGYSFKVVDSLVTNFHQPGSTHLLLVQAIMGLPLLERAYTYALANDFRFFSYGDGMVIL